MIGIFIALVILLFGYDFVNDHFFLSKKRLALSECLRNGCDITRTYLLAKAAQPVVCFVTRAGFSKSFETHVYMQDDALRIDEFDLSSKRSPYHLIAVGDSPIVMWADDHGSIDSTLSYENYTNADVRCERTTLDPAYFIVPSDILDSAR